MDRILRTTKLQANGEREASTILERARVGDSLIDAEAHLLLGARVVREHLLRKHDWRRSDDTSAFEIELDLVDVHLLPHEVEELVWVESLGVGVPKGGVRGRAGEQGQAMGGCDEAEVARVLA